MVREAKRVRVSNDSDIARALADVRADGEPRIVEKNGEELAAIVPVDYLLGSAMRRPSEEDVERALAAIGAWKDLVPEDFAERIMERRHASPPSKPIRL
jgi:hypothetical protein